MRLFKTIVTVILIFQGHVFCQDLQFELRVNKHQFLEREPIYITAELTNSQYEVINIPPLADKRNLDIKVLDMSNGEKLKRNITATDAHYPLFELFPGQSFTTVLQIVPGYYGQTSKNSLRWYETYLLPGRYRINIDYLYSPNGTNSGVNKITSNTLEIEVISPKNKNDIEFIKKFDSINASFNTGKRLKRVEKPLQYQESLLVLLNEYTESAYRKIAFRELIYSESFNPKRNNQRLEDYYKKFFIAYPTEQIVTLFSGDINARNAIKDPEVTAQLKKHNVFEKVQKSEQQIEKYIRQNKKHK